ncbi:hypothetical protein F444_11101 [Phytophthora nicotianae P1976]|uniref:Uncharacterized protein n=1 Tax=Phytophthora nicotianae P1976 TaxID=1317066 RepID=A0A081A208_PHYNI|nr:hypothetical protein F444_11101 [Phytophthora nicotianae P1976]
MGYCSDNSPAGKDGTALTIDITSAYRHPRRPLHTARS